MTKPLLVIIAGGANKNFAPLATNKTLISFCGKPLIQYTLEMAKRIGFTEILIVTAANNDAWLSSYELKGASIKTKKQVEPLGMADALLTLESEIGDRPIIVKSAADIVDTQLLQQVLEKAQHAYAVIPGIEVGENFPGGYIRTDGDRAVGIVEKPAPGKEPSNLVILTAHYFSKPTEFFTLLKSIKSSGDDVYEQALTQLMQKQTVQYVRYTGGWKKLKFSFHVLDVMKHMLETTIETYVGSGTTISHKATLTGNVYIDDGATIMDTAVIIGPAYIGKNVKIGQHTLIRQSMIEENSVVGFGSEVSRSYVGPECKLHHNYINDSVLEAHVNPSFGTCTANRRIDGKNIDLKLPDKVIPTGRKKLGAIIARNAFFGVNCSLMPGVTVGENVQLYPGTILFTPVKPNSIVKSYQKQDVVEKTS